MIRRNSRRVVVLAGSVLLTLAVSVPVATQGRFTGKVTDQWGNPLEDALISAQRVDGGDQQEARTDGDGEFQFLNLSGEYTIEFQALGYQGVRTTLTLRRASSNRPVEVDLEALPSGGRFRGDTEFEAEGGTPSLTFKEDGTFEFEDAGGEGLGTYGISELSAALVVREYDGDDGTYTIADPIIVTFPDDLFTSLVWDETTLTKTE